MSVYDINIDTYLQDFTITEGNKEKNGEVHTDFKIINDMLDLIPNKYFKDPTLKWLDPCAGRGYFCIILYKKLFQGLKEFYPDDKKRHNHITSYMLHMVELNSTFIPLLKKLFGENCHIYNLDFLTFQKGEIYDMVIGNPPYNSKGKAIWNTFTEKSLSVLKDKGFLTFITPSIWMKKDHNMYSKLLRYNVKKIYTLNNTETNKIFHGNAQTPTCYFLLRKIVNRDILKKEKIENYDTDDWLIHQGDIIDITPKSRPIKLFDRTHNKYITYRLNPMTSIPLFGSTIINKLNKVVKKVGHIPVTKTNMRKGYKGLVITPEPTDSSPYPNITTCILKGLQPELVINFSNIQCHFHGVTKLVLAHKMYGFPFLDLSGVFGISNRDNYVIYNKSKKDLMKLHQFLSTNFIITLFEATRYRMKYLERYIFELLPDITKLNDFPEDINDKSLCDYFKLDKTERNLINTFNKKKYLTF